MQDDRRRFLRVFGATAFGLALPACGSAVGEGDSGGSHVIDAGSGGGGSGAGGQGGAGGQAGAGGQGGGCAAGQGVVAAGPPSSFSADGLHKVPGTKVLIGRDAGGIYAMSSLCTHSFCNMNSLGSMNPDGAHCSCHGSNFAVDGSVVTGPAKTPLAHFAVALCDGTLHVDTNTQVPTDTRLDA